MLAGKQKRERGLGVIDFDQRIADGVFSVYGRISGLLKGMDLVTTSAFIPFSAGMLWVTRCIAISTSGL